MCGIVGYISAFKDEVYLKKMLQIQAYRGPDDHGMVIEPSGDRVVHLGHNRLSIQDLSVHGHQPFVSDCGQFIMIFNGEVYNFKTIRHELETLGYRFVSQSDTEVILYAYKEWGIKAVEKFIGMFAFALWDKIRDKILLVRDRAGVKPLYYYDNGSEFMFASELKSFHYHPSFRKELNYEVLPYYFQFGYIPAPHSIFQNCFKLEAGHYLEFDIQRSTFEIHKYWGIDECYGHDKFDASEQEILGDLETLLTDAVNLRMVSDVPAGVFLSGGYDSSLVTALLAQDKTRKLHTFTIGFEEKQYDEARHAKAIAKHFNTEHTEYYVSQKEMLDRVETLPFYYDEPFGDSSAIPTMMVSALAKKEVSVALCADGGDEAFCGYSKYFFLQKFETIFSNGFQKRILESILNGVDENKVDWINRYLPKGMRQTNIKEKYAKFKRALGAHTLEEMFCNASSYVARSDVEKFLIPSAPAKLFEKFSMDKNLSFLDNMMRVDYKTFMVDDVLSKVDRATMSVSLEGREPLLDHRIIEFMARVPSSLKYKNNQGKYLARQILYKHIPASLIDKPKSGFQIPLAQWLMGDLKPLVEKYVDASRLDPEMFNLEEIEKIKHALFAGDVSQLNAVWFIVMYEMWKERWF